MATKSLDEDQIYQWVKDNKKGLVERFFAGLEPLKTEDRTAVFMAGIPGAGKTEFIRRSIKLKGPSLIVIEHDKLVELIDGYQAKHYYAYRRAGSIMVTEIFNRCLRDGLSFVLDTTLARGRSTSNVSRALAKNYRVDIYYVIQDYDKAWSFTRDRERKDRRDIGRTEFDELCQLINPNLSKIYEIHKANPNFTFNCFDKRRPVDDKLGLAITNKTPRGRREIEKILAESYNGEYKTTQKKPSSKQKSLQPDELG